MKLPLLPVLLLSITTLPLGAQSPPKNDDCRIAGIVVKMAGSEPLKSARIRLSRQDDLSTSRTVLTDAGGRFDLKGIAPGRYRLTVNRDGFVTQTYGQRKPDDPGAILSLRPSQELKDLLFRLIPAAVIAGRVINDDGDPMPWVQVEALRWAYWGGKKTFTPETTVPTNDLGEYRLFGLPPGRYFIRAEYKPGERMTGLGEFGGRDDDQPSGYVPMYYPTGTDPARAATVAVRAGEEIPGLEISLRRMDVFTVRGRVSGLSPRRQKSPYNVFLSPRGEDAWLSRPNRDAIIDDKNGTFAIGGVLPGAYLLGATWMDENKRYQGFQSIDVGNADVDGVALTVASGMSLSGRITWDGQPSDKNRMTILLRVADGLFGFGSHATLAPTWTFQFNDVYDLTYRVAIAGLCDDCYLKAVRYAGVTSSDDSFTPTRGSSASLEVTVSSKGARVRGAVVDEDNLPAVGVWVALLPDEAQRSTQRPYKTAATDQYGRFELRGIAPGEYKLFSWEEVESGAWEDPEFLKPFEAKGEKISLQDADQKTMNLTAIRTKSPESPKP